MSLKLSYILYIRLKVIILCGKQIITVFKGIVLKKLFKIKNVLRNCSWNSKTFQFIFRKPKFFVIFVGFHIRVINSFKSIFILIQKFIGHKYEGFLTSSNRLKLFISQRFYFYVYTSSL